MSLISSLLLLILSINPATCTSSPPFRKIFAFGDSFTDTGNTKTSTGPTAFNHVSNPPYGVTFFHHPTNRYSDGRIVLDFLADFLSLPFVPPFRDPKADRAHGVNFAVGGATAIRHGFFVKNNVTFNLVRQSLQTQLLWFDGIARSEGCVDKKSTPRECEGVLGDALIWVGEIGANDYTCSLGSSLSSDVIRELAIRSTLGFLQALLNKGAKYIVIQGLPPTGCAPYSFSLSSPDDRDEMGCVSSMNLVARAHNSALQSKLITPLRMLHPESTILYADYYNALLTLIQNAAKHGFKEAYRACCGYGGGPYNFDVFNTCGTGPATSSSCRDPSEYINWDGAHFTEAANRALAASFLNGSFCSPSFRYLLGKKGNMG